LDKIACSMIGQVGGTEMEWPVLLVSKGTVLRVRGSSCLSLGAAESGFRSGKNEVRGDVRDRVLRHL